MKKALLVVLASAIVGLAGWQAYKRIRVSVGGERPERSEIPVAVETQPVRKGLIRDVGVFTGSLVPKSQFLVAPKAAGWLEELRVDIGDTVGPNDVVAVLDDEEFTRQVEQARAELQVANANAENCASDLDLARREYERIKALRDKQIASAAELDASAAGYSACQTRLKVSAAQVAQKDAALKAAELQLSYTQVQAFWQGGSPTRVVGERFVDEGTLVQMNQPIVSVLENDPLTAVVFVIERDYPKMHIGQQAIVSTDAYRGQTFAGGITRIAPLLKETSRQARVEIEISNPDHLLKPGMFVRAQIEFDRHDNATLIPLSALVRRVGKEGVFLVERPESPAGSPEAPEDGRQRTKAASSPVLRVRFVPVTVGIVDGELVEVADPPVSGDVVTLGNHLLEDGSRITLPPPATSSLGRDAATWRIADGTARGARRAVLSVSPVVRHASATTFLARSWR